MDNAIIIRTSGRRVFRRCPRKWGFISALRCNLEKVGTEQNPNFWFGSGIHFAMEDYFGYNRFKDPRRAFQAYVETFPEEDRPESWESFQSLGTSMLEYFLDWYPSHNKFYGFRTAWVKDNHLFADEVEGAKPAVEVDFSMPLIDEEGKQIIASTGDKMVPIVYHGTIDRIVSDRYGKFYLWDYKTAKNIDTDKLETDDQITTYLYFINKLFDKPIDKFIYFQMRKEAPKAPKRLKNGTLSIDKKQLTTHKLLKDELLKDYGTMDKVPSKYIDLLNILAESADDTGDKFIKWNIVTRTKNQMLSEYQNILAEMKVMLSMGKHLYANPTKDCSWDCPFRESCIDYSKGTDYQTILENLKGSWEPRKDFDSSNHDEWRDKIKWPKNENDLKEIVKPREFNDLDNVLNDDGTFNLDF